MKLLPIDGRDPGPRQGDRPGHEVDAVVRRVGQQRPRDRSHTKLYRPRHHRSEPQIVHRGHAIPDGDHLILDGLRTNNGEEVQLEVRVGIVPRPYVLVYGPVEFRDLLCRQWCNRRHAYPAANTSKEPSTGNPVAELGPPITPNTTT